MCIKVCTNANQSEHVIGVGCSGMGGPMRTAAGVDLRPGCTGTSAVTASPVWGQTLCAEHLDLLEAFIQAHAHEAEAHRVLTRLSFVMTSQQRLERCCKGGWADSATQEEALPPE